MPTLPTVLMCLAGAGRAAGAMELVERCRQAGLRVVLTGDLYHLPEKSGVWTALKNYGGEFLVVCRLHERPIKSLLVRHAMDLAGVFTLRLDEPGSVDAAWDKIWSSVGKAPAGVRAELVDLTEPVGQRWYPVVDGQRCVNCGHCLQFCLFGVYALDAHGKVRVTNPDNCKPGCPACARICPHSAIMFPLYEKDLAIAGVAGCFVVLDMAARKMYYDRTGATCPVCGESGVRTSRRRIDGAKLCAECGRTGTTEKGKAETNAAGTVAVPEGDDLDQLVADLDRRQRRRR